MALTIYHNPRCSKSRETLKLIQASGIDPTIVLYLDHAPSAAEILDIAEKLQKPVAELLRRTEPDLRKAEEFPDLDDDIALAQWLALHPRVLQRPIVIDADSGKAIIGRPPETVRALLR